MKAFEKRIGRIIDFEGKLNEKIREIAYVDIQNFEILNAYHSKSAEVQDTVLKSFNQNKIDYFVSHNAQIEKNFLKSIMPYRSSKENEEIVWGPWLDSLSLYRKMYPRLGKYDLKSLSLIFLTEQKIDGVIRKLDLSKKSSFHSAIFDCIITYLLLERLKDTIDLNNFICR